LRWTEIHWIAEMLTITRNLNQPIKRQLWLWGDRLLDGKLTGLGEWEASCNDTHAAVDLIPKDVVICDWHYDSGRRNTASQAEQMNQLHTQKS
jgi:hypothetical protein